MGLLADFLVGTGKSYAARQDQTRKDQAELLKAEKLAEIQSEYRTKEAETQHGYRMEEQKGSQEHAGKLQVERLKAEEMSAADARVSAIGLQGIKAQHDRILAEDEREHEIRLEKMKQEGKTYTLSSGQQVYGSGGKMFENEAKKGISWEVIVNDAGTPIAQRSSAGEIKDLPKDITGPEWGVASTDAGTMLYKKKDPKDGAVVIDWEGNRKTVGDVGGVQEGDGMLEAEARAYANKRYEEEASIFESDKAQFGLPEKEIKDFWIKQYLSGKAGENDGLLSQSGKPSTEPSVPAKINSKAEYDNLPSGTKFTDPDGVIRVKP